MNTKYPPNFISQKIAADLATGNYPNGIVTRFPPEPNGYLHLGHAKAICLNFNVAKEFGGVTNLRFDDTNPIKENEIYVESIKKDIEWLGFDWNEIHFTSEYFDKLYNFAVHLIESGKAYVDDLSLKKLREYRGSFTEPGRESPARNYSIEDHLFLFQRMKDGEFFDGQRVLRLKLDMASPNMNMRDPVIYRICSAWHHRTAYKWCIYPMYDFAHSFCDAEEGVTHSLCDLSYEDHRPLYDWIVREKVAWENKPDSVIPQQIEFARLNMEHTVLSKRHLKNLVEENQVEHWDDPRLPTLAGMRRRGYSPTAIHEFCRRIGVSKAENLVEFEQLQAAVRDELETTAYRVMGVLNPLKLIITNYSHDGEALKLPNHPKDESLGVHEIFFTKEIFIEKEDFQETANRKYKRLVLGDKVRLRGSYIITANKIIRDDNGEIIEVHCTYDPDSLGKTPDGDKPRGVIHWVSNILSCPAKIRMFNHLFKDKQPEPSAIVDSDSCQVINAKVETSLNENILERNYQFERVGYFKLDPISEQGALVFNQIVPLRDSKPPGP